MEGLSVYLRTLREKQGMSRVWLAEQAETSDTSIYRIEKGTQEPGPDILIGMVQALRGSWDDVRLLLKKDYAKPEKGQELAEQRIADAEVTRFVSREGTARATRLAERLRRDPQLLEQIVQAVVQADADE